MARVPIWSRRRSACANLRACCAPSPRTSSIASSRWSRNAASSSGSLRMPSAQLALGGGSNGAGVADPAQAIRTIGKVKMLARTVQGLNPKDLRGLVDDGKKQVGSGIVAIVGVTEDGKAAVAVGVTDDLVAVAQRRRSREGRCGGTRRQGRRRPAGHGAGRRPRWLQSGRCAERDREGAGGLSLRPLRRSPDALTDGSLATTGPGGGLAQPARSASLAIHRLGGGEPVAAPRLSIFPRGEAFPLADRGLARTLFRGERSFATVLVVGHAGLAADARLVVQLIEACEAACLACTDAPLIIEPTIAMRNYHRITSRETSHPPFGQRQAHDDPAAIGRADGSSMLF